jgi:hypothetical protein
VNLASTELLCQRCGNEYPIWYCDHFLWNPVADHLMNETGVSVHFLCLNCFATCCEQMVLEGNPDCKVVWKLEIGGKEDARLCLDESPDFVARIATNFLTSPCK